MLPNNLFRYLILFLVSFVVGLVSLVFLRQEFPNLIPIDGNRSVLGIKSSITNDQKQYDDEIIEIRKRGRIIRTITLTPTPIKMVLTHKKKAVHITPTKSIPSSNPSPTKSKDIQHRSHYWEIRSVSSMKETKDVICNQRSAEFINSWVKKAAGLGVNYISIETPYENPPCGNALAYTKIWVKAIRAHGLKVWHRHMPLAFEGIYDQPKNQNLETLPIITNYIRSNPDLFQAGDIFTPIPEPQNGGISGVTYCAQGICQFSNKENFNKWLRDAITESKSAFSEIGLGDQIKIGYYGFDGFVAWGHNNPDWKGILEDATIRMMGNITIDHYPELVGTQMDKDLAELEAMYPGVKIIIGEWGAVTGGDTVQAVRSSMGAAKRPSVVGFNYWHMGMGGNESLLNDDFSVKPAYEAVKSYFQR